MPQFQRFNLRASRPQSFPIGLILPLDFPTEFLDLSRVARSIDACRAHFGALELDWTVQREGSAGGGKATSILSADAVSGETWTLWLLESGGVGRHLHNSGGAYGEVTITLAGELEDSTDDGIEVLLQEGEVIFHAPDTVHQPSTRSFWAGLVHQPCGSTPYADIGLFYGAHI